MTTSRGWTALDSIDLVEECRVRVRCLQGVPAFLRGQFRTAMHFSLARLKQIYEHGDEIGKIRAWKLFRLTSRMLLWRSQARSLSHEELVKRMERFQNQEWAGLIRDARTSGSVDKRPRRQHVSSEEELEASGSRRKLAYAEERCPAAGRNCARQSLRQAPFQHSESSATQPGSHRV